MSNDHRNVERFINAVFGFEDGVLVDYEIKVRAEVASTFDATLDMTLWGMDRLERVGSLYPGTGIHYAVSGSEMRQRMVVTCARGAETQGLFAALALDLT